MTFDHFKQTAYILIVIVLLLVILVALFRVRSIKGEYKGIRVGVDVNQIKKKVHNIDQKVDIINEAVNHKAPGDETLVKRVANTEDAVARIEVKLDRLLDHVGLRLNNDQ